MSAVPVSLRDVSLREELQALTAQRRAEKAEEQRTAARGTLSMREYAAVTPEPKALLGRLDFEAFPFQVELYGDALTAARDAVVMKATQTGVSALMWRWAMRETDQAGRTTLYIFPADEHVREFAVERVDPSIDASDYLTNRIGSGIRQQKLKQFGAAFMHFRGSNSRAGAQSVAADSVVFDEYDELDQANLSQIERRLSGALAAGRPPRVRRVGVPSIPGFGVHAAYERSDRRVWVVACSCGEEQEITWAENVRWVNPGSSDVMRAGRDVYRDRDQVVRAWRACRACEAELDVARGHWVPQNVGSPVPGYHVTRLIVPRTDLEEIVRNSRKTAPHEVEAFYNNDLGLAYSPAEASLSAEDILSASAFGVEPRDSYEGPWSITMGVDVAGERDLNVRVSEILPEGVARAVWIGTASSFAEIAGLLARFRVGVCVIDANPERRMARTLQAQHPGRVFLCEYGEPEEEPVTLKKGPDGSPSGIVRVNRTEAIDGMMDGIRRKVNLPTTPLPPLYLEQLQAPKRRTEVTASGRPRRVYVSTGSSGDDYAHAEVYDLVARELLRMAGAARQTVDEEETPRSAEDWGLTAVPSHGWDEWSPGFTEEDPWE